MSRTIGTGLAYHGERGPKRTPGVTVGKKLRSPRVLVLLRLLGGVSLGLLIELILAILPAETILLAPVRTSGGGLIFIHLLTANRVFRHGLDPF
jgi:hypothetical protein